MLKAKNKNVVDIIFNNKHAIKVYKGVQLVWQKIADLLHLTQVCGNSVQEPPNLTIAIVEGGISSSIAYCYINNPITSPYTTSRNYRGVATYFKAKPNTTYSVSGNVSGNRYLHIASYTSISDLSNQNLGTSLGSNTTFTTLSDTEYVVVVWSHSSSGQTITFSDIKAIESNAQPSPSNPIEIKSVGDKTKNLFNLNGDITLGYRLNTTTGIGKKYGTMGSTNDFITDGAYCVSELMEIKPNTNYAKNTPATAYYRIHFYDSEKICVSVTNSSIAPSPANAKYMAICLPIAELGNNIQVEENSTVTEYVPFGYKLSVDVNGTISTCYLEQPLRKAGNEWDEIYRDETGYHIERRIRKLDFGKANWVYHSINSHNIVNLRHTFADDEKMLLSYEGAMLTHFSPQTSLAVNATEAGFHIAGNNILYIRIESSIASNVTEFVNWATENNAYGIYVLETSSFEDIIWDTEPTIPVGSDVVFLTEIQPSEYTIE